MNRIKIIKALSAVLCVLLALTCGSCIWLFVRINHIKANPNSIINSNQLQAGNIDEANYPTITYGGEQYYKNPNIANLLFLGIDIAQDRAVLNLGARTDMMMVCAIDTKTNKVTLISIPRDTKATITKMNDNGIVTGSTTAKLNSAFAGYGGKKPIAFLNSIQSIENFINCNKKFSVDLSLYGSIDIDGIPKIADAVGGIPVVLDVDFPGLGDKGQTITLKGDKAAIYVRERHTTGGDLKRAYRQQQFMIALAKKLKSMGARNSIMSLWDKVGNIVNTNLNTDQMLAFATILESVDIDKIEYITVPTKGDTSTNTGYQIHDTKALEEIILNTFYVKKS